MEYFGFRFFKQLAFVRLGVDAVREADIGAGESDGVQILNIVHAGSLLYEFDFFDLFGRVRVQNQAVLVGVIGRGLHVGAGTA